MNSCIDDGASFCYSLGYTGPLAEYSDTHYKRLEAQNSQVELGVKLEEKSFCQIFA